MRPTEVSRDDDEMYMDIARRISERSHDQTIKVGSVIVKGLGAQQRILSYGWNGMPTGEPNEMEVPVLQRIDSVLHFRLRTNPRVRHSELNACSKMRYEEGVGSILYVTLSPCEFCAQIVHAYGIIEVVYDQQYKSDVGIQYLRDRHIVVRQIGE